MTRSIRYYLPLLLLPLLLLSLPSESSAQVDGAYNTIPYDSLNPSTNASGRYSALWGYTAPDGREYALLGGFTGTHIVDITEKPIVEVAFIPGPNNGWREMKTYGTTAYIVSEGGAGLQIVDLSALPDSAVLVREDTETFETGHTITQEGDWIYVHGMDVGAGTNQGTMIYEVATDPLNPVLVGTYERSYVHDVSIRNDTMYGAMINDGRLDIVHLSPDRTETTYITTISYPGAGTHSSDHSTDGRYIMTTDEVGSTQKTMKVWDRSDIDDIVKVADYTPEPRAIIHNIRKKGELAYCAWYTAGTRILDVSDPVNPVEVGFYDFYEGEGQIYQGNWEVYPYFASGKIIASSTIDGLHVFTFNGSEAGSAVVTIIDSATGEPLPGVGLELPELGRTEVSDANGQVILAAAAGETRYTTSLLNYRQNSGTLELLGSGNEVEIVVAPLAMRKVVIVPVGENTNQNQIAIESRYVYDVVGRPEGGEEGGSPAEVLLPADSSYVVKVGAWGYVASEEVIPANGDSTSVRVVLQEGYYDDADLDLGWSLGLPDDDAIAGYWERGLPQGVEVFFNGQGALLEPAEDDTPGEGGFAFMTDIAPSPNVSPGQADVDSGRVTLTSPAFDLSDYAESVSGVTIVSFSLWFSNDAVAFFPADDQLYVRLSNDGGDTWVDALTLNSGLAGWMHYEVTLQEYLELTDNMHFRVVVSDSLEQGWVEAGLDNFEIMHFLTGVNEDAHTLAETGILLRPQPTSGDAELLLDLPERLEGVEVVVYTTLGERVMEVFEGSLEAGKHRFRMLSSELEAGHYHVVVRQGANGTRRAALIITR